MNKLSKSKNGQTERSSTADWLYVAALVVNDVLVAHSMMSMAKPAFNFPIKLSKKQEAD